MSNKKEVGVVGCAPRFLIPNMYGRDREKISLSLVDFCLFCLYTTILSAGNFQNVFCSVCLSVFTQE